MSGTTNYVDCHLYILVYLLYKLDKVEFKDCSHFDILVKLVCHVLIQWNAMQQASWISKIYENENWWKYIQDLEKIHFTYPAYLHKTDVLARHSKFTACNEENIMFYCMCVHISVSRITSWIWMKFGTGDLTKLSYLVYLVLIEIDPVESCFK